MTRFNKIIYGISSFLVLCLIILIVLFFNFPRVRYSYDSNTDSYYVSDVYGNAKTYKIEEEINNKKVTFIGERAFQGKSKLEEIILPPTIEKIEKLAFSDCKSLKNINLDDIIYIERNAFSYCTSLNNLNVRGNIGGSAFYGCTSLESISFNRLVSIGTYAFCYTKINSLVIPDTIKDIYDDAFIHMPNLEEISLPSTLMLNSYINSLKANIKINWR